MSAAALTWRQYRLERRMFWRNPSAAFFNFLLPLLFLALFGAVFSADQSKLDVIVPGIAGMSVMATTFSALAFNIVFLREAACSSASAARRSRRRLLRRRRRSTRSPTRRSRSR